MPSLAIVLREHKAGSRFSRPDEYVFCSRAGTPLQPRKIVRRGLDKATEGAGIGEYVEDEKGKRTWKPAIRWHDLRHCFASILIDQGEDPVSVSRQIGHADPSITLSVYAHLFDAARNADRMRAKLEQRFGNILATTGGDRREDPESGEGQEVAYLSDFRTGANSR